MYVRSPAFLLLLLFTVISCDKGQLSPTSLAVDPGNGTDKLCLAGEIPSQFRVLVPFPDRFTASIEGRDESLKLLGAGATGPVYKAEGKNVVYKFRYQMPRSDTKADADGLLPSLDSNTLEDLQDKLNDATVLYESEKKLVLDLPRESAAFPELQDFSQFVVPSRLVEVRYGDMVYEAIEKEYLRGVTIDALLQRFKTIRKHQKLMELLGELYQAYRKAMSSGHHLSDLNDGNVMYVPKPTPRIVVVDGGYDGHTPGNNYLLLLERTCSEAEWCTLGSASSSSGSL